MPKRKALPKRRNGTKAELEYLEMALCLNGKAMEDEPKKKHWSIHDIKTIKPLTPAQEDMFHAWFNGNNVCAHGSAGTGKTFLALYLALLEVLNNRQKRIILVRSVVPTREIGFMPGDLSEKTANYEDPYHDILWELIGKPSSYKDMKDAGVIEFVTTSFIRGLTWDNAVVIVDESQNLTFHEINSVVTRLGENSRIIFTGDTTQTDLDGKRNGSEGMSYAIRVFDAIDAFACIPFTRHDIVRSEIVKQWIVACEDLIAA